MEIGGLKLKLVNDFKLLGHRCVAAHRFVIQDADEAATEAKIRVNRIATLPLDYTNKLKVLKTSPIKVFVASTQWGIANMANIATLTSEIIRVMRGTTRKLRAAEIVFGLIHEATDYHPRSAMIWNTIANARRMMNKDGKILQQAKEMCERRRERISKTQEQQDDKANRVVPTRRLNQKTKAEQVAKQAKRHDIAKAVTNSNADAEDGRARLDTTNDEQSQAKNDATTMQAKELMTEMIDRLSDLAEAETIDCSCANPTEVTKLDGSYQRQDEHRKKTNDEQRQ